MGNSIGDDRGDFSVEASALLGPCIFSGLVVKVTRAQRRFLVPEEGRTGGAEATCSLFDFGLGSSFAC